MSFGGRAASAVAGPPAGEAIQIRASWVKHLLLALPCAYLAVIGGRGLDSGIGDWQINLALVAFGIGATVVLLAMGFSRKPVLSIDAEGIRCRRPDLGLLPWRAVAGLGLGRAPFARTVLIVAVDEAQLTPEAAERVKRERSSILAGPQATRYRGKLAGYPTVSISIALLAISPRALRRILESEIRYDDGDA